MIKGVGRLALALLAGVVLVLALIGALHTFRGTPISRVRTVGDGAALSTADPLFRPTVELLTGSAISAGNEVEILQNGDGTFPALWSDLRSARHSITLRLYYVEPGRLADTLAAVLAERARAGIPVYLLLDAIGSALDDRYLDPLRAAGVKVARYRPVRWYSLNRAQNRSHVRAVVVDGRVGYTGGFGIADQWLGDGRRRGSWRETNVRFSGPAVMQLQAAFVTGWAEATGTLLTGPRFFPSHGFRPAGSRVAGLLYSSPGIGSTEAERFLALTIGAARRTLYVTNSYFVPDDDLRRLLVQAERRGVDVRVLTAGEHTDVATARLAAHARYEELLRAGVRIFEYRPTMVHAKTVVADGVWGTVGTMNFDNRSAALNEESNLVVLDPEVGARLDSAFYDDLRHAREIRLERFSRRPWHRRLLEGAATLLTRVL